MLPIDIPRLDESFGADARTEIVSTFLTHAKVLFGRLDQSLVDKEVETTIDTAHQVKGMSASIYAESLRQEALVLEKLAKGQPPDWPAIGQGVEVLKARFSELESYLGAL